MDNAQPQNPIPEPQQSNIPVPPAEKATPQAPTKIPIIVMVIITVLSLALSGYLGYQNYKLNQLAGQPEEISPSPTPISDLNLQDSTAKVFMITFTLDSEANTPPMPIGNTLSKYIETLLGLPEKSISTLLYDTRGNNPYDNEDGALFKSTFYIVLTSPMKLDSIYTDQYLEATIKPQEEALLPYLIKTDYCEKDSDCTIRSAMCSYGAYNHYQVFVDGPWGCGPSGYKSSFSWFEYGAYDQELNCKLDSLEFDKAECKNSACTEQGVHKVCVNE